MFDDTNLRPWCVGHFSSFNIPVTLSSLSDRTVTKRSTCHCIFSTSIWVPNWMDIFKSWPGEALFMFLHRRLRVMGALPMILWMWGGGSMRDLMSLWSQDKYVDPLWLVSHYIWVVLWVPLMCHWEYWVFM